MGGFLKVDQNARQAILDARKAGTKARYIRIFRQKDAPRGPRGFRLCRWCGQEVPSARRTFCGDPTCLEQFLFFANSGTVRKYVYERDKGVCAACGEDSAEKHRKAVSALEQRARAAQLAMGKGEDYVSLVRELSVLRSQHTWEAHHLVPCVEGGGLCGLSGYCTLCLECHQKETKALAARRALARNKAKVRKTEARTGSGKRRGRKR